MIDTKQLKPILEALIMASSKPISVERILECFSEKEVPDKKTLRSALKLLADDYAKAKSSIELKEVSSGFRFQIRKELSEWVSKLWEEKPSRYSRALLETLSLVAYKQPITRGEIEKIRGVSVSSQIMKTLLEREWVHVVGHRDVPGRPAIYATTKQFLDYFNLKSLDELPPLAEIKDIDNINGEFEFSDSNDSEIQDDMPRAESAIDEDVSAVNVEVDQDERIEKQSDDKSPVAMAEAMSAEH